MSTTCGNPPSLANDVLAIITDNVPREPGKYHGWRVRELPEQPGSVAITLLSHRYGRDLETLAHQRLSTTLYGKHAAIEVAQRMLDRVKERET